MTFAILQITMVLIAAGSALYANRQVRKARDAATRAGLAAALARRDANRSDAATWDEWPHAG